MVQKRDLFAAAFFRKPLDIRGHVREAPIIHDTADALAALTMLARCRRADGFLVHDEYGHFEGIITVSNLMETILGEFRADAGADGPDAVQRDDGSWLLSGSMAGSMKWSR